MIIDSPCLRYLCTTSRYLPPASKPASALYFPYPYFVLAFPILVNSKALLPYCAIHIQLHYCSSFPLRWQFPIYSFRFFRFSFSTFFRLLAVQSFHFDLISRLYELCIYVQGQCVYECFSVVNGMVQWSFIFKRLQNCDVPEILWKSIRCTFQRSCDGVYKINYFIIWYIVIIFNLNNLDDLYTIKIIVDTVWWQKCASSRN